VLHATESTALLARFAEAADRQAAAAELARHLGVDEVLAFVRDPELGVLLPVPGFPQTVVGGASWRAFLKTCATPGTYTAEVDYGARETPTRVVAHVSASGGALLFFGGAPDERAVTAAVELLPLLGALFRAEHEARLARGEAEVARASGGHATNLALALDAARTEVERALAESARLNAELQETDGRKDEFMAMLGHELRNPMAAISGAIEVMRSRPDDAEHIGKARAIIERQTEQLARLVDDLLDVARITRGKIALRVELLDVEEIVRRAIESTHGAVTAKQHELRLETRSRVHTNADRTRLEQMVTNLLTNAVKYTDPGGHILIEIDREGADAIVRVEDDGIGIAPEMLPHIFDAFLQVDAALDRGAGGLGVGLTLVRRLALLHDGRVDAQSTLGKGSVFTLRLPAADPARSHPAPEQPARATLVKKRVLVVDDNFDSAEMMVALAQNWGHEAFHAGDGRAAVAMAHELAPDIVLLDIGLPGMDGYEVAAKLRVDPVTQRALIIAVSGYGLDADRLKSHAAGCDEHLVKPVDLKQLARVLGR
jgi:signal transduction histidine kinase/CheY-like chemotaxis protein